MTFKHGGHIRNLASLAGCKAEELLDFSANINPLGPPGCLRRVISRHLSEVTHYPDPHCLNLRKAIASAFSVPAEEVICGNGSTELIYALPRALPVTRAIIPVPSYTDYAEAASKAGLGITTLLTDVESGFSIDWSRVEAELSGGEMVIAGQPGNPSGTMFDPSALLDVADRHLSTFFVVDEAFADFVDGYQSLASHGRSNIIILRSMTKFYAIPGLRLGYALAPEPVIQRISEVLPPWSVGSLAQAAGAAALEDEGYAQRTRREIVRLRDQLQRGLMDLDVTRCFPSAGNYLLVRLERTTLNAAELARRGELVAGFGASDCGCGGHLVRFGTEVEAFRPRPVKNGSCTRRAALAWFSKKRPGGRTNLFDALARALGEPAVDTIFVLTDGAPSAGEYRTRTGILMEVARRNRYRKAVIHTIEIGADRTGRRWRGFLADLARRNGGRSVRR